jgi:DNA-binding PadR family transcriptional regulator
MIDLEYGMNETDVAAFLPLKPDEFEVLLSLETEARHGYAILKLIEARGVPLAASLLYRKLKRLMESGLVVEASKRGRGEDSRRRYYRLTALGDAVVRAEAIRIVALSRSMRVRKLARAAEGSRA